MRVLVTGAGLVGTQSARQLVERGDEVVLFDLRPDEVAIRTILGDHPYVLEQGDVSDAARVRTLVERHRIESVIHTAATLTRPARENPVMAVQVNVGGTVGFLELQRLGIIRRLVFASSSTITYPLFGQPVETPIPEDFLARTLSQHPGSVYSTTKLMAEMAALTYRDHYGLDPVGLRFTAILGAWPRGPVGIPSRMLGVLLDAGAAGTPAIFQDPTLLWSGGEEFTDARDAARATLAALEAPAPTQTIYNVTTGILHTFEDVVAAVRVHYPNLVVQADLPEGGFAGFPFRRPGPSSALAASRDLGFTARHDLAASIAHFVEIHQTMAKAA